MVNETNEVDSLKNPLDTNLEVWILDNDQRLHTSYKKILKPQIEMIIIL